MGKNNCWLVRPWISFRSRRSSYSIIDHLYSTTDKLNKSLCRCNNKWAKTLLKLLVKISTEGAFDKLKGRWKVLSKRYENSRKTLKRFGFAYIVLHNTCIDMGDIIPWNILLTNDLSSKKYRPRRELRRELQMTDANQRYLGTNSEEAKPLLTA